MFIHDEQLNCFRADVKNVFTTKRPDLTHEQIELNFNVLPMAMVAYGVRWLQFCRNPDFIM